MHRFSFKDNTWGGGSLRISQMTYKRHYRINGNRINGAMAIAALGILVT